MSSPYQQRCRKCFASSHVSMLANRQLETIVDLLVQMPMGDHHKKTCPWFAPDLRAGVQPRKAPKIAVCTTYEQYAAQAHATRQGATVTITVSGEGRSGKSSIAELIMVLLAAHGVNVTDATTSGMGVVQAAANLRRIGPMICAVVEERQTSPCARRKQLDKLGF